MKVGPSDPSINRVQTEEQPSIESTSSSSSGSSSGVRTREQSSNIDQRRMVGSRLRMSLRLNPGVSDKVLKLFGLRSLSGSYSPLTSSSSSSTSSIRSGRYSSTDSLSSRSTIGSNRTSSESDESYYSTIEEDNESIYESVGSSSSSDISIYDSHSNSNSVSSSTQSQAPELPPRPSVLQREVPEPSPTSTSSEHSLQSQSSVGSDDVFLSESETESLYADKRQASKVQVEESAYGPIKSSLEESVVLESKLEEPVVLESNYITFGPDGVIYSDFAPMPQVTISSPQSDSVSTPPPVPPRDQAAGSPGVGSRSRLSSTNSVTNSLFDPNMQLVARQAIDKTVHGNLGSPKGPKVNFPYQVGGHSNTGYIVGTDLVIKQHVNPTEQEVYMFMSQFGEWLKDPQGGPENAPEVLSGLTYPQLSVLHSHRERLLGSLPIPVAMGGTSDNSAVVLLNPNKRPDGSGGFMNVSGFESTDVKVGPILVSKSELSAHYPKQAGGLGWARKVVTGRIGPGMRGATVRGYDMNVGKNESGFSRLQTAVRNSDDAFPKRLGALSSSQLESLERTMEGLQQAAHFLPVTFVGSTLQFVLPNPGDTTTIPRVMLSDIGHPIFKDEATGDGPINPRIYDKYKSNFTSGMDSIKDTISDILISKVK